MNVPLLLFLLFLLAVGLLFYPLGRKPFFPLGPVLVAVGLVIGQAVTALGIDIGLRWYHFQDLLVELLLPLLLFRAALELDAGALRRHAVTILLLVLPLMLFMLAVTACVLYFGIGHPAGFPWLAACLAAALLAATDLDMVPRWLDRAGYHDIATILEGESIASDTTAVVLFSLLLGMAAMPAHDESVLPAEVFIAFGRALLFGLLAGVAMGLLQRRLLAHVPTAPLQIVVNLVLLYVTYLLTDRLLGGSAVIAVVVLGLLALNPRSLQASVNLQALRSFWTLPAALAEYLVYLLAGVTITLAMFADQWLAMLLGILAVLGGRMIAVLLLLPMLQKPTGSRSPDARGRFLLGWSGGIRSVFTLALALSLPLTIDYWYTVQSIAYGTALFGLFVQGGGLAAWLAFRKSVPAD